MRLNFGGNSSLFIYGSLTNDYSPARERIHRPTKCAKFGNTMKQESKPLTDAEREITNKIVQSFWKNDELTSRRDLLRDLKPLRGSIDRALRNLVDDSVLNVVNNTYLEETYSPKAVAFFYSGDPEALAFAKKSTELMLQVVRNLFDRDLDTDSKDQKQFTREDALAEARTIDPTATLDMVRVGLALAEEFSVFYTLNRGGKPIGVTAFRPGPRIFEIGDNSWDEHLRQSRVSVERTWEQVQAEESQDVPPSAGGLEVLMPDNRKIFVVHGHAEETKNAVATFLRSLGLEVIILHEQANQGQTIVEKFEKHSNVGFAVVLLTPDDFGGPVSHPEEMQKRARQNVILELGIFIGKLGRERVCPIYVEGVELPSDIHGVLYVPYDVGGNWKAALVKELGAAGIAVDSKKSAGVTGNEKTADSTLNDVTMIARKGGPVRFPR